MRAPWQSLLLSLAVVGATVVSGNLECDPTFEKRGLAHGEELYGRMCAVCHGESGEGYKADQAPALAGQGFLATVSDGVLTAAITHGRVGTTMSAWGVEHGGPLSKSDVAAVVQYLRSWQRGKAAQLDESPLGGDAARGNELFSKNCATCHGLKGVNGQFESIGNAQLFSASTGFLRFTIENGRDFGGRSLMPAFRDTLSDEEVDDVIAALRAWQAGGNPAAPRAATPARPPPLPLGPVPLHPAGPEPVGFDPAGFTKADVVYAELKRGARMGLLDARAPSDYTGEHIAGAVSVPFYAPEPYYAQLPKDAWLVCYCGCPHAESGQLAQKLRAKGFKKVTVIDEGLRYWSAHHYGTAKGALPYATP